MYKSLIFSTAFELRPRGGGCDRRQLLAFRNDHCNLRDRGTSLHLLMQMPSEVLRFAFCVLRFEERWLVLVWCVVSLVVVVVSVTFSQLETPFRKMKKKERREKGIEFQFQIELWIFFKIVLLKSS